MSLDTRRHNGLLATKRAISRALSGVFPRLGYLVWAWRNPGKSFKDFYAESVTTALEGKKEHASLGPLLKDGRDQAVRRIFKQLISQGISPADTVVDYGCGTLRIGRPFIEFLDADRYVGMDIDERILDAGRRSLPAELIVSKQPTLAVITHESVMRVAERKPRWIFAKGVLQHVPPSELNEFFANLAQLIHSGAVGFLYARCGKESTVLSAKSWRHDFGQLEGSAARYGMKLDTPTQARQFMRLQAVGAALVSILQFLTTDIAGIAPLFT